MKRKHIISSLTLSCGILMSLISGCDQKASSGQNSNEAGDSIQMLSNKNPQPDSTGYIVRVGQMAPDFNARLTNGKMINLSDFRSKVVMLQFTASWCGVCRAEMPHIEKEIWQKHKDNPHFVLIGIDRDEPLEKVIKFGEKVGVTYPLALDPGADIFAKYAIRDAGITRNVLIGRDGKIVRLTRLFNEDEFAALVKDIDTLLQQKN